MSTLGRYLQARRFDLNLSIAAVSRLSDVAPGTLRAYEQGRRLPSVAALNRLFVALDLEDQIWVDANTWEHPETHDTYVLASGPGGGGVKRGPMPKDELDALRIDAIAQILTVDTETLKAIITLLKRS